MDRMEETSKGKNESREGGRVEERRKDEAEKNDGGEG